MSEADQQFPPVEDPSESPAHDAPDAQPPNIDALLRERSKLDALIQQQFRREVTLFFSDIRGSTAFYERRGDLSGRQMVQRHNDLLFPIIPQHQGTVLRFIGDAIMATFAEPAHAVEAAIAMQQALQAYNGTVEAVDQIHIRIGINSGQALVEANDVFGDVVNVAARVNACAVPDQILVGEASYRGLPSHIRCRPAGAHEVKGKAEPIALFEVIWDEHQPVAEPVQLRGQGEVPRPQRVLVLDISREAERLKLCLQERRPEGELPVRQYEYLSAPLATVQAEVDTMLAQLRQAFHERTLPGEAWEAIKACGARLYHHLLTPRIQEQLRGLTGASLVLTIDDTLVQIPWELLFDGQTFLCRRFSMGRIVRTQQALGEEKTPRPRQALKVLIIADPQGNLPAAAQEGQTIREVLGGDRSRLQVEVRGREARIPALVRDLAQYDVLHYAGHADYDLQDPAQSGWFMADGKLTASELLRLAGQSPLPALVFCNACRSGQTDVWQDQPAMAQGIYGLANAFLRAGAHQYIGTFWEIPDQPSCAFAVEFYQALTHGAPVGDALRLAREAAAARDGEGSVVWASYVLYGDPTARLLEMVSGAVQAYRVVHREPPADPAALAAEPAALLSAEQFQGVIENLMDVRHLPLDLGRPGEIGHLPDDF